MKRIIAVLLMAAIALTVSGCGKEEGENSSSQTSDTASQVRSTVSEENSTVSSSSSSANVASSRPKPSIKITLSEARAIFDDFLTRLAEVRFLESTEFVKRDTDQKLPGNPDYCLIEDEQIKGCKTVEDLKKLLNTAYSMRHIDKFLLPKYIYCDDPYYIEYDGQLYIKNSYATHINSICEYDYDTFKIVEYNGDRLIIKCDRVNPDTWDDTTIGWWNRTEVLKFIRENEIWVLDQYEFIGVGFGDEDSYVGFLKDEWYD